MILTRCSETCTWPRIVSCALKLWLKNAKHGREYYTPFCLIPFLTCVHRAASSMSRAPRRRLMFRPLWVIFLIILLSLTVSQVPEFISQRRRWLNGSLFASIHATVFFFRIWTSGQNIFRMFLLQVICSTNLSSFNLKPYFSVRVHLQCNPTCVHMDFSG